MIPIPGNLIHLPTGQIHQITDEEELASFIFTKKSIYNQKHIFLFTKNNIFWGQLASEIYRYFHQDFKKHSAKLTEQEAAQIYLAGKQKVFSLQELADMFGVSKTTIHNIMTGKTWKKIHR